MSTQKAPTSQPQVTGQHGGAIGLGLIVALWLLLNPAGATTGSGANYCTQTAGFMRRTDALSMDQARRSSVRAAGHYLGHDLIP
jgi:hypothetical protein